MFLSSLLHELHLSEKPRPSAPPPPITELLSRLQEKLIGSDSESCSLIGRVERLFKEADPDWLFCAAGGWAELQAVYLSVVEALIGRAALPPCDDDVGSAPIAAYHDVPSRVVPVCSALSALLGTLGNEERSGVLLSTVAPPICVFAVTHFQEQPWTSNASRAAARRLQEALLRAGRWRDSAHLLMGEEGEGRTRGIVGGVLDVLQPQLDKDSWQRCEAVKFVFAWTLLQLARPSLSSHLPHLLPPSLLLSDHYRPENCILGVRCVHHIVLNTAAAELRQFNMAEVLYQAMFKHLLTTDADVIQVVLSCLLDLLLVLEKPPSLLAPSSARRKSCRHDDVLRLILTHMEAEHKVALRRVYASALPLYVDRMGVAVCRHLRRLERVVMGYMEVKDPPEETSRLKMMEAMKRMMEAGWPRMSSRVDVFLRLLLRLLVDVSSDSDVVDSVRRHVMDEASLCLRLLDGCSGGTLQLRLLQVDSSCCSPEVLGCLATVTVKTER